MNRRGFITAAAGVAAPLVVSKGHSAESKKAIAMTVQGPIVPEVMGVTLPHEHVLVDFIGADKVSRDRYDANAAFEVALPHLKRAHELGVCTMAECTPAYIGRDAALCARLSRASGLHILTNTGYYGAANDKFLPAHAHTETAAQLSKRWSDEWHNGIEATGIRPGFIKVGVDSGPLSEIDRKLVRAAALTHLATGLTIASHTGGAGAGMEELKVLADEGVDWRGFIWVHAQNERNLDDHVRAAEGGAWIEFDNIGPKTIERVLTLVQNMKAHGLLHRILLSHDAGWYHVGEPGGGNFRPYDTLLTEFIPALKEAGFTGAEMRRMTADNPREAFTVRVRPA